MPKAAMTLRNPDLAPKAAMPLMAVLTCMASFPPELVGQRTAIVIEIRERCL